MERQEARSLRVALQDMDSIGEDKVQVAAKAEAKELVDQHHQGGGARLRHPSRLRSYREHLEKGAHARSVSQAFEENAVQVRDFYPLRQTSGSDKTESSPLNLSNAPQDLKDKSLKESKDGEGALSKQKGHYLWDSPERKAYMNLSFTKQLRKTSDRRRSSGNHARQVSGSLFSNPDDKIYEEPQDNSKQTNWSVASGASASPEALTAKTRNSMSKFQTVSESMLRSQSDVAGMKVLPYRSEIHKNPPSRSRDPSYVSNKPKPVSVDAGAEDLNQQPNRDEALDGKEIRSDDIRAATSKRLKDRSNKLPSPSVVSQRSGRPIVSFDQDLPSPKEPIDEAVPQALNKPVTMYLQSTCLSHHRFRSTISKSKRTTTFIRLRPRQAYRSSVSLTKAHRLDLYPGRPLSPG